MKTNIKILLENESVTLPVLRAPVPYVLFALSVIVPHVSSRASRYTLCALRVLVPHVSRVFMPHVPFALHALVPHALSVLVPLCLTVLYVLPWLTCSMLYVLSRSTCHIPQVLSCPLSVSCLIYFHPSMSRSSRIFSLLYFSCFSYLSFLSCLN